MEKRNVAIIAHVDHGKTKIVDGILKSSGMFRDNEDTSNLSMDSNDIERERGITILAKTTAIDYKGTRINILDTPGHADFGGEVERIMNMVDGVILVVDAYEGAMPQTRFVLKKAFEAKVKPIVVINKIDKESARPTEVLDEILDLFIELGADDELLDFKTIYTSALNRTSSYDSNVETQEDGLTKILDTILEEIPAPTGDSTKPLQFQPALLDYNEFVGRIGIGRITNGKIKTGEMVTCARLDGTTKQFRIQKLFGFYGYNRIEIEEAEAGDIIAIAGLADISVGETICNPNNILPLPKLHIDEPTLQMTFGSNSSPLVGKDGKIVTSRKIGERLDRETQRDVSLKVEQISNESFMVSGRGELHLGILIENMRREGFEIEVSKPQVIIKEIDGVKCEPYEKVIINVPNDYSGTIIQDLSERKATMELMEPAEDNYVRLEFSCPTRGLIGYRSNFITNTKGEGIMVRSFDTYKPYAGEITGRKNGVLVSMESGKTFGYALYNLLDRGTMIVEPSTDVYEGMIVGIHNKENDLNVNPCKNKEFSNTRSKSSDEAIVLPNARTFTLEEALEFIETDELVEVTPDAIRLRKKILDQKERFRSNR